MYNIDLVIILILAIAGLFHVNKIHNEENLNIVDFNILYQNNKIFRNILLIINELLILSDIYIIYYMFTIYSFFITIFIVSIIIIISGIVYIILGKKISNITSIVGPIIIIYLYFLLFNEFIIGINGFILLGICVIVIIFGTIKRTKVQNTYIKNLENSLLYINPKYTQEQVVNAIINKYPYISKEIIIKQLVGDYDKLKYKKIVIKKLSLSNTRKNGTPRHIINKDFKIDLPISGGWGYTKEDAVIIDKKDISVQGNKFFDGVGYEYIFVEKRIFEELIIFRTRGEQIINISSNLVKQSTLTFDGKDYDKLVFIINGEHETTSEKIEIKRVFWFDITSFY